MAGGQSSRHSSFFEKSLATTSRKNEKSTMVLHVDLSAERGPVAAASGADDGNAPSTSGSDGKALQRKYLGVDRSRPIAAGDVVIVYERHDRTRALVVTPGEKFNNQFGAFHHDVRDREEEEEMEKERKGGRRRAFERERQRERAVARQTHSSTSSKIKLSNKQQQQQQQDWIGAKYGSRAVARSGKGWLLLLAPSPELWTCSLPHRTQILYAADIALVCSLLELAPGAVVLETGTGSGSLTHSLAEAARRGFADFATHEVLLRGYDVRRERLVEDFLGGGAGGGGGGGSRKSGSTKNGRKKRQRGDDGADDDDGGRAAPRKTSASGLVLPRPVIVARPSCDARGHTGYLTFARKGVGADI